MSGYYVCTILKFRNFSTANSYCDLLLRHSKFHRKFSYLFPKLLFPYSLFFIVNVKVMSKACPVSMPFWFMSINSKDNNFFSERELYDVVSSFCSLMTLLFCCFWQTCRGEYLPCWVTFKNRSILENLLLIWGRFCTSLNLFRAISCTRSSVEEGFPARPEPHHKRCWTFLLSLW